jgi:chromosomal replication initiation ATPase DnaA
MSSQLTLQFTETVAYSSERFIVHSGVKAAANATVTLAAQNRFALLYIHGATLSGKTHLAVYCAGLLSSLKRPTEVVTWEDAYDWYARSIRKKGGTLKLAGGSLIFDDADKWLSDPKLEGTFTAIEDAVLQNKGLLILMGSQPIEGLTLRPQTASRLIAGAQVSIETPDEHELDQILDAVTKQRGLNLNAAKRRFVLTRIARTVPDIVRFVDRLSQTGKRSVSSFDVLAAAL